MERTDSSLSSSNSSHPLVLEWQNNLCFSWAHKLKKNLQPYHLNKHVTFLWHIKKLQCHFYFIKDLETCRFKNCGMIKEINFISHLIFCRTRTTFYQNTVFICCVQYFLQFNSYAALFHIVSMEIANNTMSYFYCSRIWFLIYLRKWQVEFYLKTLFIQSLYE